MSLLKRFGNALQLVRKSRRLTQEDFSDVSSRTYLSSLERGMKAPTITKVDQLANVMGVHPLSLLALAYLPNDPTETDILCNQIRTELAILGVPLTAPDNIPNK